MKKKLIFVVHLHYATHKHYDLRLEMNGVLRSWAVPKEPPLKAGIKRLAIKVDNHPLSYASFHGRIPEGQYGAGIVEIWDKGYFKLIENTANKILVDIHGNKLRGMYELINFEATGKNKWLFFKKKSGKTNKG